jgi:hypothetical protein
MNVHVNNPDTLRHVQAVLQVKYENAVCQKQAAEQTLQDAVAIYKALPWYKRIFREEPSGDIMGSHGFLIYYTQDDVNTYNIKLQSVIAALASQGTVTFEGKELARLLRS